MTIKDAYLAGYKWYTDYTGHVWRIDNKTYVEICALNDLLNS
jgi:hypothetical protein